MPKTEEYKDKRGENRIRHIADNGKITYSSSEGYKNKQDMRDAAINAAIELLEHFVAVGRLSDSQLERVILLGDESTRFIDDRLQGPLR